MKFIVLIASAIALPGYTVDIAPAPATYEPKPVVAPVVDVYAPKAAAKDKKPHDHSEHVKAVTDNKPKGKGKGKGKDTYEVANAAPEPAAPAGPGEYGDCG